jgi:hypothetical protein
MTRFPFIEAFLFIASLLVLEITLLGLGIVR